MKIKIPTRIAEMLFAFAIGTFGVLHFISADIMSGLVPDIMPGDRQFWIYFTGGSLVAAALAILLNKLKRIACYLLAAMLLIFVFTLHIKPAMDGNPANLLKDTALAMAAIIIGNKSNTR